MDRLHCTVEKLHSLQQLQITLHHTPEQPPFTPLLTLSNQYPYKPILNIHKARSPSASPSAFPPSSAPELVLRVPLNVRVNLSDVRNRVAQFEDATVITLKFTTDIANETNGANHSDDDFPTAREAMTNEYRNIYCQHCSTYVLRTHDSDAPATTSPSCPSSSSPASHAPFKVNILPTPYWSELTDLWFCHTGNNAHIDRLASMKIEVTQGRILVDKLLLRMHRKDLAPELSEAWKQHASVKKIFDNHHERKESDYSNDCINSSSRPSPNCSRHTNDCSHTSHAPSTCSSAPSSSSSSSDLWSPLPCTGCSSILGTILLTLEPTNSTTPIRPAETGEVRLFKYQLSNCFRRQTPVTSTPVAIASPTSASVDADVDVDVEMQANDDQSSRSSSSPSSSLAPPRFFSCSCPTLVSSSNSRLLTCSNMYRPYSFENFIAEDLLQRYHKQPIGKFLIESIDQDEDENENGSEDANEDVNTDMTPNEAGCSRSRVGGGVRRKMFIRLFVTQWQLSIASSVEIQSNTSAARMTSIAASTLSSSSPPLGFTSRTPSTTPSALFSDFVPFSPQFGDSNDMSPVLKVEFDLHHAIDEPALQRWFHGKKYTTGKVSHFPLSSPLSPSSSSSSHGLGVDCPSHIDHLFYSYNDCQQLVELLRSRAQLWPKSIQSVSTNSNDPTMRKSCITQLKNNSQPMIFQRIPPQ